jgi:hypothetical protein
MGAIRSAAAAIAILLVSGSAAGEPLDPKNPTCPLNPDWSTYPEMHFTLDTSSGHRILLAEGQIDEQVPKRLSDALKQYSPIEEIWLRSPGGVARAGNDAGLMIRQSGIPTRIPKGWACFSACNFMFMGGRLRFVDPDGSFIVHMFTHVSDPKAVASALSRGPQVAAELIGDVEQDSALLASEDNDFLIRMGVSRKLLTEVMYQQKAVEAGNTGPTRRCLTRAELVKYNVTNAQ